MALRAYDSYVASLNGVALLSQAIALPTGRLTQLVRDRIH